MGCTCSLKLCCLFGRLNERSYKPTRRKTKANVWRWLGITQAVYVFTSDTHLLVPAAACFVGGWFFEGGVQIHTVERRRERCVALTVITSECYFGIQHITVSEYSLGRGLQIFSLVYLFIHQNNSKKVLCLMCQYVTNPQGIIIWH